MTIRRVPEDFQVDEVLRPDVARGLAGARDAAHGFAVYELSKVSLATPEAKRGLARALGVSAGAVEDAGLKDKHAQTMQHVSVAAPGAGAAPARVGGAGWSARLLGWSEGEAAAGWIARNRFRIVVRDLTPEGCAHMERAAGLLGEGGPGGRHLVLVNYFGAQRFGSARHGEGFVARHLVRGEFERALRLAIGTPARKDAGARRVLSRLLAAHWGDWEQVATRAPACPERSAVEVLAAGGDFAAAVAALPHDFLRLCVEAYQSHLWNAVARRLAYQAAGLAPGTGGDLVPDAAVIAADVFGTMVFPLPGRLGMGLRMLSLPLLAPETRPVEPWRGAALEVLAAEGLALEGLRVPGLRRPVFGEAPRGLVVRAEELVMGEPEPDEMDGAGHLKRVVQFALPRGAYATVVLRALGE